MIIIINMIIIKSWPLNGLYQLKIGCDQIY